jgi:hypothetical protein
MAEMELCSCKLKNTRKPPAVRKGHGWQPQETKTDQIINSLDGVGHILIVTNTEFQHFSEK